MGGNRPQYSRVDLAREIAKRRPDLHEDQAIGIIDMLMAIIAEKVMDGERVSLRGFGTFRLGRLRAIPAGSHFPGQAPLQEEIPARPRVIFKQSRVLKTTIVRRRIKKPKV